MTENQKDYLRKRIIDILEKEGKEAIIKVKDENFILEFKITYKTGTFFIYGFNFKTMSRYSRHSFNDISFGFYVDNVIKRIKNERKYKDL